MKTHCKQCGSLLEYVLTSTNPRFSGPMTFWRYRHVLPKVQEIVSLGEGGTPLHKAHRLAESLNFENLYLKDETRSPTSSFKDRSASLLISDAKSRGYDSVVCATNGNHGASISAYSARVDLRCNLVVPSVVDMGKLAQMMIYDAKIVQEGNTIEEAIARAIELEKEMRWYQATTELNPLSIEALKTISYEIVEQQGVPDWIILAMGSDATLHALWKGFTEMEKLGIIHKKPALMGVQARGYAPISSAFTTGDSQPQRLVKGNTEASAIRVKDPIYGKPALDALRDSGGFAVDVWDEDMIKAGRLMAGTEGIFAEPASAAPIASLQLKQVQKRLDPDAHIICLVTSSGLKSDDILSNLTKRKKAPRLGSRFTTKEKILRVIEGESSYGYAIWKSMGADISIGAVYQHINDLEVRGLIVSVREGKRKKVSITERGRRVLQAMEDLQVLL